MMEPTEFIPYIYKSTPIFMNESFKKMKTIDQYCVIIIEQVNNAKWIFLFSPDPLMTSRFRWSCNIIAFPGMHA